jgi:DNA mismatch endonuclease, patch repair protein
MATRWNEALPEESAWRARPGMTAAERAEEQDRAAGSREGRVIALDKKRHVLASIYLRLPQKSRRIYAYLRWSEGRKTREKYVCQVSGATREENLASAWSHVRATMPPAAAPAHSWASSPATRVIMRANRPRDTRPELALRSAVHARGLRYRVAARPIPGLRRTADLVFPGPRVAVFLDGCFWHGCVDHYRPSTRNSDFWSAKVTENRQRDLCTDELLAGAGWKVVRVWEHEDPDEAALRVEAVVMSLRLGGKRS